MAWHTRITKLAQRITTDKYRAADVNYHSDQIDEIYDNLEAIAGTSQPMSLPTASGEIVSLKSRVSTLEDSSGSIDWVRQTVLTGSVDATGAADFLSVGEGLSVELDATTEPVTLAFADGFSASGSVDHVVQITEDMTFVDLPETDISYLYIDLADSVVTVGSTTYRPHYGRVAPAAPSEDQHWFSLTSYKMYRYSGSAWVPVTRVFVGEAHPTTGAILYCYTYALRGEYVSPDTACPAAGTNQIWGHKIGTDPGMMIASVVGRNINTEGGHAPGNIANVMQDGSSSVMIPGPASITPTAATWRSGASAAVIHTLDGNHTAVNAANWSLICRVSRGW